MMKKIGLTCSIILLVNSVGICKSDVDVKTSIFFSAAGKYFITVYKGEFLSASDIRKRKQKKNRQSEPFVKGYNACIGELYKIDGSDTILVWRKKLLNTVAPAKCIVSDDGKYVATFDSWYPTLNDGKNVMVVYDSSGMAIANYSLNQISPHLVDASGSCFPGNHWRKETSFSNDSLIKITYSDKYDRIHKVKYDIIRQKFDNAPSISETEINLNPIENPEKD